MGNLLSFEALVRKIRHLKRQGKKIAFTNGCFDLLHVGHLETFERIKRHADCLIVAVNSDSSVRRIKGRNRPLVPARERARLVASLKPVDYVTIFSEETPRRVIRSLRPDLLAKGADWKGKKIAGQQEVESWGGRFLLMPYRKNRSSTRLLRQLRQL